MNMAICTKEDLKHRVQERVDWRGGEPIRGVSDLMVSEFYREVIKLCGFLGRKSDGQPGWITIWRGREKLATLVREAEHSKEMKSTY